MVVHARMSENVEVVTLRNGSYIDPNKKMIHKTMTPDTRPEDMIVEAKRYLALTGCKYAPKLLGVTGDAKSGECRGLLIELVEGLRMTPIPFMYNNMRLSVTVHLMNAMVEFEDKGVYLPDLKPDNIILTSYGPCVEDGLFVIDYGPGVTDGLFLEEEIEEILDGRVGFKSAMYGFLMTLRMIWNEGKLGTDGIPTAPTGLRARVPTTLLGLLDNPHSGPYSNFREVRDALKEEMEKAIKEECMLGFDWD